MSSTLCDQLSVMAYYDKQPEPSDMTWTYVRIFSDHAYPFVEASHVYHREDLSDLDEPYLSAVKAARELKSIKLNQDAPRR
jgi:hypothetical protein